MIQTITLPAAEPTVPGVRPRTTPMAMCPMAKMCEGIMEKRPSRLLLMLLGVVLIVVGVLIFLEPRILVWLMDAAAVLLGIGLLMMANFIRGLGIHKANM